MKIGILTFQFAHNYGAMLQAYALKSFLNAHYPCVDIVPYFPKWAQKEYAISPFAKGISLKKRIRFAIQYPRRKLLAARFEDFAENELGIRNAFDDPNTLAGFLNQYDAVVFGSDQIWNDSITGKTTDYYGGEIDVTRIAYAASLGTKTLTEWQSECAARYLPRFSAISVREQHSAKLLEQIVSDPIETVLDPVFLLTVSDWEKLCVPSKAGPDYMLLYFLRNDDRLLAQAQRYAKENGLTVYEIHPTMARAHNGCRQLHHIGPKEFLWLIRNAECVCTNSFHATSFCMIFGKKLLHTPNANSPERTVHLLRQMGYPLLQNSDACPLYDLSDRNEERLTQLARNSKRFLLDALGKA